MSNKNYKFYFFYSRVVPCIPYIDVNLVFPNICGERFKWRRGEGEWGGGLRLGKEEQTVFKSDQVLNISAHISI